MVRETLPQQRARETRTKILDAARFVFGRRGFSQATIEEIAEEAGVSNGALYHHFAAKEELFKAIVASHISDQHFEISALAPASSLRDLLERFAVYWFDHLRKDHGDDPLFAEIWAQAARDPWARESVTKFIHEGCTLIKEGLEVGQSAGVIRDDLDVAAAATLIYATMEGLFLFWTVDPDGVDAERLTGPWVESMERLLTSGVEPNVEEFQRGVEQLFEAPPSEQSPQEGPQ
ncbi:MAG: TetR/AcrR family transcriptional regulator [Chloroflexi bacterium]|nr:TetR/AcrR family transcriptional regulator [Chloroflexota bacterium]